MQFRTIHEMLTGPSCSCFGWDLEKKIVTAKKAVWDAYVLAINFKNKAFPYYEDLCMIYGRDHAIGKKCKSSYRCENLNVENMRDDIDDNVSFSLASRKHPKTSNKLGELNELTTLIVAQMKDSSNLMSHAMGQEINDKQVGLSEEMKKISGLTMVKRVKATTQIARDCAALNVFYSPCDEDRETWAKLFLNREI
ncbi:DDE Tnp4 domain-containing protein [Citrus sinensis]|nr:DDE Tnp4 domain-containing protein [Citrus sinensis]